MLKSHYLITNRINKLGESVDSPKYRKIIFEVEASELKINKGLNICTLNLNNNEYD